MAAPAVQTNQLRKTNHAKGYQSMQPLLTIGMAHFDDFSGLWPTIQSIRLNNSDLMAQTEFVVVNNNPEDRETANAIKGLLGVHDDTNDPAGKKLDYTAGVHGNLPDCFGTKYVELPGNRGTSISREQIFRHARGKYTAAMDCHLEFWPNSFRALMAHYATDPESSDIISGPLMYDSLRNVSTHFNDEWDDAMWGKWGAAYKCACGRDGVEFSLLQEQEATVPILLKLGRQLVNQCRACRKQIPSGVGWSGHESRYMNLGFIPLGFNDGPAFEIPGQGLGFFSCRTAAWPGFNPHAVGFGGEELYIQEKFRRRGGRALCVPGMKWVHRFYRTGGAKYPNTTFWKARNYVLEYQELGWPLDPVKAHFVDRVIPNAKQPELKATYLTQRTWDALVADPINVIADPTVRLEAQEAAGQLLPEFTTIEQLFESVQAIPRDLDQHMPAFRVLAQTAGDVVVELTARRESTIALLAGRPKQLISFSSEVDQHCFKAAHLVSDTTSYEARSFAADQILSKIPNNDLLFIDTKHSYAHLVKELQTYTPACRRFIVLHDTEIYGTRGDDSGIGLNQAIAEFCDANPQWAVVDHTKEQHGLTVLSCQIGDRPETPVEGFNVPAGPGTELKQILHSLGIHPSPDCSCNGRAAQMDIWGADGCEDPEHFPVIVDWLKSGTWNGLDLANAAARSFFTGMAFQINPLSPFESLVKLCIKRARETAAKRKATQ
jgi:hypothetical protein